MSFDFLFCDSRWMVIDKGVLAGNDIHVNVKILVYLLYLNIVSIEKMIKMRIIYIISLFKR